MQFILGAAPLAAALFGIYATSFYSYLLFHGLAEVFSIVIAFSLFMVAWNVRRMLQSHYLLFIGIAYLYVGGVDLLHTLAYKGMGVFEEYGANLATQLWIGARYLEALSLLSATVFLRRKIYPRLTLTAYGALTGFLLLSIFYWKIFPDCFVEGVGLTPFKIYSEYAICLTLLATIAFLLYNSKAFDSKVLILLIASILLAIFQELAFTTYFTVYGSSNLIGHILKIISFYLIYKAIIETGLITPCNLLFRDLKQSEAKFRSLFDTNIVPIAYCHMDGSVLDANDDYLELLGYTRDELRRGEVRWDQATPPEWKFIDEEGLDRLRRNGVCAPLEKEYLRRDGTRVPVLLGACLLPGESEQVVAFVVDLTEQKKLQEELRKARDLAETRAAELEAIYSTAPVGLCVLDMNLKYQHVNDRLASLSKRPALDHPGRTIREVMPEVADCMESVCRQCIETGEPVLNLEITALDELTGMNSLYLTSFHPLRDAGGCSSGINIVLQDITERKRMEEALRLARDELEARVAERTAELASANMDLKANSARLERLNKELQEFAFIASHDLQEPLRKIQTFSTMIVDRCESSLENQGKTYLMKLTGEVKRMSEQISCLLAYSRLAQEESLFEPTDLTLVARECLQEMEPLVIGSGGVVELGDLPLIEADHKQMRILFHHLIDNSLKFRSEREKLVVRIRGEVEGEVCRIIIEDNGIGFEERYAERIFRPFQRLHGRKSGYAGLGIGLAICRKIAYRHNGAITVKSAPGSGATFTVALPLRQK